MPDDVPTWGEVLAVAGVDVGFQMRLAENTMPVEVGYMAITEPDDRDVIHDWVHRKAEKRLD